MCGCANLRMLEKAGVGFVEVGFVEACMLEEADIRTTDVFRLTIFCYFFLLLNKQRF